MYLRPWTHRLHPPLSKYGMRTPFAASIRRQSRRALPHLSTENSDGIRVYILSPLLKSLIVAVEDIAEEQLYRYTRNRWMHVGFFSSKLR
jgi:hypothetical protein